MLHWLRDKQFKSRIYFRLEILQLLDDRRSTCIIIYNKRENRKRIIIVKKNDIFISLCPSQILPEKNFPKTIIDATSKNISFIISIRDRKIKLFRYRALHYSS